jgi:hypothetical protein
VRVFLDAAGVPSVAEEDRPFNVLVIPVASVFRAGRLLRSRPTVQIGPADGWRIGPDATRVDRNGSYSPDPAGRVDTSAVSPIMRPSVHAAAKLAEIPPKRQFVMPD